MMTEKFPVMAMLDKGRVFLEQVFALFPYGVTMTDAEGRIIYYNPAQARIDELTPEEALGKKLLELYAAGRRGESSVTMECLNTGLPVLNRSSVYKTRRGKLVNALHHAFPLHEEGRLSGALLIVEPFSHARMDSLQAAVHTRFSGIVGFESIVGGSPLLRKAIEAARAAAQGPSSILLCGATGTGKEMFARSIHGASPWASGPYLTVNCAAIPANLLEGILFGTSRGSFTGALEKKGLFEESDGGLLYLDELDSMPLDLQAKLLRTLQERKVRRVGSAEERPFHVKLVCSISSRPEEAMRKGLLRPDLFYRVGVAQIVLPALAERMDDLDELCRFFLLRHNQILGRGVLGLTPEVMHLFRRYPWPGNVRELEHIIEGALNLAQDQEWLGRELLPDYFFRELPRNGAEAVPEAESGWRRVKEAEQRTLSEALSRSGGHLGRAAGLLGISRQLLAFRMKKHGLKREDFFPQV